MVKKLGGGNKHKKKKNHVAVEVERQIVFKTDSQEYAQVTKLLGSCRLEAQCFDGKTRLCHIRGAMRKKVWITVNDVILVSLREYEDGKCDVIHKYMAKEIVRLKNMGEIPESVNVSEDVVNNDAEDLGIDFESDNEEKLDINNI